MSDDYSKDLAQLEAMKDDLRRIRDRTCEPKNNSNRRYHALSSAVSSIDRAIADMQDQDR